jgi:uncharacterized protein (TIGR02646 family)
VIYVARNPIPPSELVKARLKENEDYAAFLKNKKKQKKLRPSKARRGRSSKNSAEKFSFKAYRLAKSELERSFHFKCAYCESSYAHTSHVHIDHYRPKGRVDRQGMKPIAGYYWLAAEWRNLLPICQRCNSPGKEFVPALNRELTIGKRNWFPLWDEAKRAKKPGGEKKEDPLLLNPCEEDPEDYFVFYEDGRVEAKKGLPRIKKLKAMKSIEIYGLWRQKLIQTRGWHAKAILGCLIHVRESYEYWRAAKGRMRERMRERLIRDWNDLQHYLEPNVEYISLAKSLINARLSNPMQNKIKQLQRGLK